MRLILASTSPRRREILALLGVPFDVIAPEFDERVSPHLSIEEEVLAFAVGKARSVGSKNSHSLVIGSDTMISLGGDKIGKPADRDDAARILRALAAKTHEIYTSVAILDGCGGPGMQTVEQVSVAMRPYTEKEIERYLCCDESDDKAGAYSIQGQGASLIKSMTGDYLAAVGMPLKSIADYLKSRQVAVLLDVERFYADKAYLNWRMFA